MDEYLFIASAKFRADRLKLERERSDSFADESASEPVDSMGTHDRARGALWSFVRALLD